MKRGNREEDEQEREREREKESDGCVKEDRTSCGIKYTQANIERSALASSSSGIEKGRGDGLSEEGLQPSRLEVSARRR